MITEEADPEEISIHAAREGGDIFGTKGLSTLSISIHAAREGGDIADFNKFTQFHISIHAAREGGDLLAVVFFVNPCYFNPRRP